MPQRNSMGAKATYDPCSNPRDVLDVGGKIGDLVNCYVLQAGKYLGYYGPLVIVGIILVTVMLISAYMFIKD